MEVHVHFDASDHQFVILKSSEAHITVFVAGAMVTVGPVALSISATRLVDLDIKIEALSVLAHFVLKRRLATAYDRPGPVERTELRDALIAIDGDRAGATRRQIAAVTFGNDRVAAEWSDRDGSMRHKIKRDLARGRRLIDGGYRDLLQRTVGRAFGGTL